jgi:hypothetical protein
MKRWSVIRSDQAATHERTTTLKATLTPEAPVFTLEIDGKKLPGMRQDGQLGPVLLLKDDKGREVYLYDGTSRFALAFTMFGDKPREVTLIAASPQLMDTINPPQAAPEATQKPSGPPNVDFEASSRV